MSLADRMMGRALEVAREGMGVGEMPIAAVVAVGEEAVAEAYTKERTQRRLLVHADPLALDKADRDLGGRRRDAALYVTLEPCLMCLGAAFTMRIGSVVYGLESPSDGGCEAFGEWDRRRARQSMPGYTSPHVNAGVRRPEAADLFRRYAADAPPGWAHDWVTDLARLGEPGRPGG